MANVSEIMSEAMNTTTPVRARRVRAERPTAAPAVVEAPPAASPPPVANGLHVEDDPTLGPVSPERVRQPLGRWRRKLDNSERPGFHRHWFNDYAGRIDEATAAGYTHVKDSTGNNMKRVVGPNEHGGGLLAYRMEIPQDWYDADQKLKREHDEAKLNQIRRGEVAGVAPGQDGAYQPVNKAGTIGADIRIGNRK